MTGKLPPFAFTIFGVTGDLSARKLLPALYHLHVKGYLHPQTRIVGFGRTVVGTAELRTRLGAAVAAEVPDFDESAWQSLAGRTSYCSGGYDDEASYLALAGHLDGLGLAGRIFYTATPPETYADIASGLAAAGLAAEGADGFSRLVVEKPFGDDLASARRLNAALLASFEEQQLFRIDHYLAKETAQNLAVLRFANSLFEPIWSNRYLDHVQITMAEPMGIEGRGSFYESAGVLKDVFQNHLLQLLALVAMEPPAKFDEDDVRDEKVKLLRAVRCPRPADVVLGQYQAARDVKGYRDEDGVAPDSRQATFAAMMLEVRNWRLSGVPFFLRSGKRLEAKASEIVLQLRNPPHLPFDLKAPLNPDRLILRLVPDEGITVRFNGKRPGAGFELDRIDLDFSYQASFAAPNPDAYETLLLDVAAGDATLFMRADEVEAQWAIMQPVLDWIASENPTPIPYRAGSAGPEEAFELLERSGRSWYRPSGVAREAAAKQADEKRSGSGQPA